MCVFQRLPPVLNCRYRRWPQIPLFLLSFLFRKARRNCAYRERFLFRYRVQDFAEALTDRRPVVAGGGLDGGFFVAAPQFRIAQEHDDRLRERTGIVDQNNVAAVMNIQSFGSDGGGNDGLGCRHGLVDFQTRTASDAQGADNYGGLAEMLDDRGHTAGDFDRAVIISISRIRGPLLNPAVGIAADDAESRLRHFGLDRGPDFTAKIFDAVNVRLPVHGADEGDEGRVRIGLRFALCRFGAIVCEIDAGGDDGNTVAIHPPRHEGTIVFGDGNHMLELADYGALVAEHLPEFHAVHHLFCGIARSGGVAAPDFAFHVVLEQHTWDAETSGKVDRGIQEIADGDIETPFAEPGLELLLDFGVSKAADRIRRLGAEMSQIVETARGSRKFAPAGANCHRAGQLLLQIELVVWVGRSSIVRIKRKLMPRGQVSQDVVRADIAAVLHGEELIGFYPENSHAGSSYVELLMSINEPRLPFCQ